MRFASIVLILFALTSAAAIAARQTYLTSGTCDGLPRVDLKTIETTCVGLVADGLKFPRGILPLANAELLIVTMGGWGRGQGALVRLTRDQSGYRKSVVIDGLDRPHAIARGPDGKIYVGVVGGVIRFDLAKPVASREDVIGGFSKWPALPASGLHPLVNFVFSRSGDLYVAVGSHSNNCETDNVSEPASENVCAEASGADPRGSIRRYRMQWPAGKIIGSEVVAQGLRNSMALVEHPVTGKLYQGENSRDAIHRQVEGMDNDDDLPHDELNLIEPGRNFGWPYCYDGRLPSPEYPSFDCRTTVPPHRLLPAHAAPLSMVFYSGSMLPRKYGGALIMAFHGYRRNGHRIVTYAVVAAGR